MTALPPLSAAPEDRPRLAKRALIKTLLIILALVLLHIGYLWYSLTPRSPQQSSSEAIAQLRLERSAQLPKQASGDLFVKGRARQDDDPTLDEKAQKEAEAKANAKAQAGDYQLLAVLTINSTYYALFANGVEQQKLTLGDTLPNIGVVSHIDRRTVIIDNPDAEQGKQQFLLFPILERPTE